MDPGKVYLFIHTQACWICIYENKKSVENLLSTLFRFTRVDLQFAQDNDLTGRLWTTTLRFNGYPQGIE